MAVMLHAIEALAGLGRYSVVFRYPDGTSLTAVVQVGDDDVTAAEASLPAGWTSGSPEFAGLTEAVLALHRARAGGPQAAVLQDVDGGWDVMMGNVVLDGSGTPSCTAHGPMVPKDGPVWECADCGALAQYAA